MAKPIAPAFKLSLRASWPTVAPMVRSPVRMIGAGIAPVLRSRARVVASSVVKLPWMIAVPPAIASLTIGAEINWPPTKMAIGLPTFLAVRASNMAAPSWSNWISTNG